MRYDNPTSVEHSVWTVANQHFDGTLPHQQLVDQSLAGMDVSDPEGLLRKLGKGLVRGASLLVVAVLAGCSPIQAEPTPAHAPAGWVADIAGTTPVFRRGDAAIPQAEFTDPIGSGVSGVEEEQRYQLGDQVAQ